MIPAATLTISAIGQYVIALAVGQRAAGEHRRALEAVDELAREPALADPGLAVDRQQVRAAVADDARERVLQQLELELAADEGRRDRGCAADAVADAGELPHRQRVVEALQLEEAALLACRSRRA